MTIRPPSSQAGMNTADRGRASVVAFVMRLRPDRRRRRRAKEISPKD